MERTGLCYICSGIASPAYTCKMCGNIVCSKDFRANLGVCSNCEKKFRR